MLSNELTSDVVIDDSDVVDGRERSRQHRIARLAGILWLVVLYTGWRLWSGNPMGIGFPNIPRELIPPLLIVCLLAPMLLAPLLGAGRSPHVTYRPGDIDVGLDDIRGASIVKEEVVRSLNLFRAHQTFRDEMGGTPRRAILFEGPPGTGKTYLAKAMAGEAGVPFLFVSSSAFQSMYYGQTNRKIRSYFRALRKAARAEGGAIGFIEEIDAIGGARSGMGSGRSEGVSGVVNELLIQLQSFDEPPPFRRFLKALAEKVNALLPSDRQIKVSNGPAANVLILGATNRAADLDPALVRPGRFDRSIHFDAPGRNDRREIIDYYLDRKSHAADLDRPERRDDLASATFGYTPVMLEHLFDEALVWALRRDAHELDWSDIQQAKMTEELGLQHKVEYVERERRTIATHESGHATVAFLVGRTADLAIGPHGRKLEVLSIIKRRQALGLLAHSDTEERFLRTRSELLDLIQIALGGMVAEQLELGESGTGPGGDLQAATTLAVEMVGRYGMAGSLVSFEAGNSLGTDLVGRVLNDEAGRRAVEAILDECRADAERKLRMNRHVLCALRDALLDQDELVGDQIESTIMAALNAGTNDLAAADTKLIDLTPTPSATTAIPAPTPSTAAAPPAAPTSTALATGPTATGPAAPVTTGDRPSTPARAGGPGVARRTPMIEAPARLSSLGAEPTPTPEAD